MTIFRNVVFVAALAGLVAGVVMAAMQAYATVPLIVQAETFEGAGGEAAHDHGAAADAAAPADDHSHNAGTPAHAHDEEGWAPADGFERFFFTTMANIVTGIGFGLILVAVSEFAGGINGWREGIFWGLAGFFVFTVAPGIGLPPNLPAMPGADTVMRQAWWVGTAAATAIGIALIVFRRSVPLTVLAVALIAAPHLIGAPQPDSYETAVPEGLHRDFIAAVTVTNLVFWVVLGAVVGVVRERFSTELTPADGSLA